ncbi:MAG: hypothetical protein KAU62_01935 [Candidatus Heimdallarchaeota archaeon]|nr:hypothetical protein [Candidatus Heimdallarchaeota archaeon]MCK4609893.1 hypothetical protein [Candidatus Heimdallarchaeota archaeon]
MVKPKIDNETKNQKFKRIASARTRKILNDLRLLGNCSNRRTYSYSQEEVNKIFNTIEKEIKRTKSLFSTSKTDFSLD